MLWAFVFISVLCNFQDDFSYGEKLFRIYIISYGDILVRNQCIAIFHFIEVIYFLLQFFLPSHFLHAESS